MAQQRRRRKQRGTQGGAVKKPANRGKGKQPQKMTAQERREQRLNEPPTWKAAIGRAALTSGFLLVVFALLLKRPITSAFAFAAVAFIAYLPAFYFFETFMYQRRQRQKQRQAAQKQ